MERQYSKTMDDIIFFTYIDHLRSKIQVMELKLVYDESYREDMYVGCDEAGLIGHSPDDIIIHHRESCETFTYYFTDDLDAIERDIDKNNEFEYFKLL